MKIFKIVFFVLFFAINGYSQSVTFPNDVFIIDTQYVFRHFSDLIITTNRENKIRGNFVDTVYSCNYNKKGNVLCERNLANKNIVDGTYFFIYDSIDRVAKRIFYEESVFKESSNVFKIDASIYYYATFDSVSQIETYSYHDTGRYVSKNLKDGSVSHSYEKSGKSKWVYIKKLKFFYNSEGKVRCIQYYNKDQLDGKTEYNYDSLNRLGSSSYCQYAFTDNYTRDTNSCQLSEFKYHSYDKKNIVEVDTFYFGRSMIVSTKTKSLNKFMNVEYEKEEAVRYDIMKDNEKDGEWSNEIRYYFNDKNQIIKRVETNLDEFTKKKYSQVFNYYYKL